MKVPDDWGRVGRAWLCKLLSPGQVIYNKLEKSWGVVLIHIAGEGALLWNLAEYSCGTRKLWSTTHDPDYAGCPQTHYSWAIVVNPHQYSTRQVERIGHAWRLLQHKVTAGAPKITAIQSNKFAPPYLNAVSEEMSLYKGAAYKCFDQMSVNEMRLLAANDCIPIPPGADDFGVADVMCRHYLAGEKISEAEFIDIFAHRDRDSDEAIAGLLDSKEVEDCFGEEEQKLLAAWKRDRSKRASGLKQYREKLNARREYVAKDVYGKKGVAAGKADPKLRGLVRDGTRTIKKVQVEGRLSEEEAAVYLPPDSKVTKSLADNRWRVSWVCYTISRSWAAYGEWLAFKKCAAYIWSEYTKITTTPCPWSFLADVEW